MMPSNSGQYRGQYDGLYASPDQDTPSPNTSAPDFSYDYSTDMSTNPHASMSPFNPSGSSAMPYPYHQQARSYPPYQLGIPRVQERAQPTQLPNPQRIISPTGIWNPAISAQIYPTDGAFSQNNNAQIFPTDLVPLQPPQSIDLSHSYNDAVHPSYRNIRLKCLLKDPKGFQQHSKVIVRREKRVVLEIQLQAEGGRIRDMGWKGIALPRTGSVKQSNAQAPARLLYFSIEVHGSTTGLILSQPCDNCWRREMRPLGNPPGLQQYLIDFKSDSPFVLFPRAETHSYLKAEATIHFICYSNHQKEDYELVAKLFDEQNHLVAYYQIPYSFKSVAKPDRDGGLQDEYPSIVPPVVSPINVTMPPAAGLNPTASIRRPVNASGQRPAPEVHHRTNTRRQGPSSQHPPNWESAGAWPPVSSLMGIQQPEASGQPLLQRVVPIEGPTRGGLSIVLIGDGFPPWPTTIYARFGSAVAATSWINPFTLECTLPTSPISGLVDVTLSLSPDYNAQQLGRSLCTFMYRDEQESFLLMLRSIYSQGHELSRVALDILMPSVLQHATPETLGVALRRVAQDQDSLPPIDERELEDLGVRFLASISDSQHWRNDLSVADNNGQTIAHLCVLSGYTRLLTKIVEWGIDLDAQDVSGLTALHCAYLREEWDCVRILKEAGASVDIEDDLGRIPRKMCQPVESDGSERGEEEWVDVPSRLSASPENFTLLGTQSVLRLPQRSLSGIKTVRGIHASPMPIPRPPSENSSSADDDWLTAFSSFQISDSPPRVASSISSSSGRQRGGAPQYGWSQHGYPPPPPVLQRNVSSGAYHARPGSSSINRVPTFPMPQPAVPLFPVPEPTGHLEDSDDCTNTMSQRSSPQRSSPSPVASPVSRRQTMPQTTPLRAQPVTHSNSLVVPTRPGSSHSIQRSHQPSPSASSARFVPPPGPPPPPVLSPSVVSNPPPQRSQFGADEKAAMRHQVQEVMRAWPTADQEKEKMKFRVEQKTANLEKGALVDPKTFARGMRVAMDHFQPPKQGET